MVPSARVARERLGLIVVRVAQETLRHQLLVSDEDPPATVSETAAHLVRQDIGRRVGNDQTTALDPRGSKQRLQELVILNFIEPLPKVVDKPYTKSFNLCMPMTGAGYRYFR